MRRAIQRMIQDPLAMQLLSGQFIAGDTVVADADPATRALRFVKLCSGQKRESGEECASGRHMGIVAQPVGQALA